jgi:cell division protease FtsH
MVFLGREISEQRDYSDSVAEQIDDEVQSLIGGAYDTAMRILKEYKPNLDRVSEYLLENETIEGENFADIFDNPPAPVAAC